MKKVLLAGVLLAALLLSAFGLGAFSPESKPASAAMTELSVQGMTCGSCVGTIREALGQLEGIEGVDIVVTTGRSQVLYDPERLDAATIAATISASGFPATVNLDLSSSEYQTLQNEESRLAERYLARIGTRLIPRAEFEQKLERTLGTLLNDAASRQRARTALWQELKQREILLASAERNQVVVPDAEVEERLREVQGATPDFETAVLSHYGGLESFTQRLKEDLIISRNIELHVLAGIDNPLQQQRKMNQWFKEVSQQTPVTLYDKQLKQAATKSGSSCGGGCCPS